jgi:hypothetical protein
MTSFALTPALVIRTECPGTAAAFVDRFGGLRREARASRNKLLDWLDYTLWLGGCMLR